MSIWCSHEAVGYDEMNEGPQPYGGQVRSYAIGWSNHYPTTDDQVEQPASVGLAHIPTWCVPGWRDHEGPDDYPLGPWVRLDISTWEYDEKAQPTDKPRWAAVVMPESADTTAACHSSFSRSDQLWSSGGSM